MLPISLPIFDSKYLGEMGLQLARKKRCNMEKQKEVMTAVHPISAQNKLIITLEYAN